MKIATNNDHVELIATSSDLVLCPICGEAYSNTGEAARCRDNHSEETQLDSAEKGA